MAAVWFITGASRGLGREITVAALARGDQVVATARDTTAVTAAIDSDRPDLLILPLDVTNTDQSWNAVDAALDRFGRIDVLVNNAGYGLLGAVEETSDAEARALFDVNFFGLLNVTRAVLPVLRRQRSGHVINIGSAGGFALGTGYGIYGASKFAVEGITEALAADLDGLGVRATVVEPGMFRTDIFDPTSLRLAATRLDDYAATAGQRRVDLVRMNGAQRGDPRKAAEAIVDIAHAAKPPLRLQLGPDSIARVTAKLALVAAEQAAWRHLGEATDHDDADARSGRTGEE
ncbi:oxidoreductase [Saccharopolyspora sp. K220]|uniref:oxidoreductase n=1 Tax=Saccharopolyspora soli TaxID=2926618 RepID=UPI001F581FB4|nr:oxidoreductase [Saccharopolyspora soli]MCI2422399.1 oxidoreductase [Saccharopolyspora soli]